MIAEGEFVVFQNVIDTRHIKMVDDKSINQYMNSLYSQKNQVYIIGCIVDIDNEFKCKIIFLANTKLLESI